MPKPAYPKTIAQRIGYYLMVVEEVKARLALIVEFLNAEKNPGLIIELCYLELRLICENIALMCLTAQGDFKTYRWLSEESAPSKIFKALERVNPDFYIQPLDITKDEDGVKHMNANPVHFDFLKREELEHLWAITGNFLHRLPAAKYVKNPHKELKQLQVIESYNNKIVMLLNQHLVTLLDKQSALKVQSLTENGRAMAELLHFDESNVMKVQRFEVAPPEKMGSQRVSTPDGKVYHFTI